MNMCMSNNKYWFYIEPYVFVSIGINGVLYYNTLDDSFLQFTEPEVIDLTHRLLEPDALQVIEISAELISIDPIKSYIKGLRERFMGDFVDIVHVNKKPIQLVPRCKIVHDFEKYRKDQILSPVVPMVYLSKINIFVNYTTCADGQFVMNNYQFHNPLFGRDTVSLTLLDIKSVVCQVIDSGLNEVNVILGNLSDVGNVSNIIYYLNQVNVTVSYYILESEFAKYGNSITPLTQWNGRICLLIYNLSRRFDIQSLREMIDKFVFCFVVTSEEEYDDVVAFVMENKVVNYEIRPYFTGNNLSFFENSVFIGRDDVLSCKHPMKSIFRNQKINNYYFGSLNILPNGDVHASLYSESLGNIKSEKMLSLVEKELFVGRDWRCTRKQEIPCMDCCYSALCPPISDYERALGRNDLCKIRRQDATYAQQ